jgi:hypothetical protein
MTEETLSEAEKAAMEAETATVEAEIATAEDLEAATPVPGKCTK